MAINKYIVSSCIISGNAVYKNGEPIFVNGDAPIVDFLVSVYKNFELNYSRFYKMDNLSKLGWLASEILLNDSFEKEDYQPEEVGLILSNTNSSLDTDIRYMASVSDIPSPSVFVYTLPNIVTGEICIRNNFKGEDAFFIFDSFNAGFLESYLSNLLDNNILKTCICGWVELLGDNYKAALFLVENKNTDAAVPFTEKEMNRLFNTETEND